MEPHGKARRGKAIYVCPECGYEMELTGEPEDVEPEEEG